MDYLFVLVLGFLLGQNIDRILGKFYRGTIAEDREPVTVEPMEVTEKPKAVTKKAPVVTEKPKNVTEKPKNVTKTLDSCSVCQGEKDIYLGKQKIKCPSCYGWEAQAK